MEKGSTKLKKGKKEVSFFEKRGARPSCKSTLGVSMEKTSTIARKAGSGV